MIELVLGSTRRNTGFPVVLAIDTFDRSLVCVHVAISNSTKHDNPTVAMARLMFPLRLPYSWSDAKIRFFGSEKGLDLTQK